MLRSGFRSRILIRALLALPLLVLVAPRVARAAILSTRVTPTVISPNGDGVRDRAVFSWTISTNPAAHLRYTITADDGKIAVDDTLLARPIGTDSLVWNGTDSLGVRVRDGLYSFHIEERTAPNTPFITDGSTVVRVDVTPPALPAFDEPDTIVVASAFTVSGIAAGADTVVLFRDGVRADTSLASGTPPAFAFPVTLIEGHNRFSVQAEDIAGNFSPQTTDIDVLYVNPADVSPPKAVPVFFSPNGDGVSDTTRVQFSLDAPTAELNVQVRRGIAPISISLDNTQPVTLLYDAAAGAGPYVFAWDGRDSAGTIAADGVYVFAVKAESLSAAGVPIPAAITRYAGIRLDTVAPPTPVLEPAPPARSIRRESELTIRVVESDSVRIFRNGALVASEAVGVVSGTTTMHVPVLLLPGDNAFAVQALDFAGNRSALSASVNVRYDTPLGFHAPEKFRAGDAFSVNLDLAARAVVIDLFTLRGDPVRQLSTTSSATRYELPWDLKDSAGNFVGDGPYLARLRVTNPDGSVTEGKAAIVVVK
jgi:flagellar hook assembly protein FlgD